MDSPRLNLLDEPLIRIRDAEGTLQRLSLPALFVQLGRDAVRDYPALRPHQRHPWHALLVQLAALALHEAGETAPWDNAADWRTALLALTPDHPDGCAFSLLAPHDQPAFLQAPVPGGSLEGWKEITAPDALDMLVTSKNHDLKGERMRRAKVDDWVFAICALQTEGAYTKAGPTEFYFGSVRMSGLQGSRPHVGVMPNGGPGRRWIRDVRIGLLGRETISDTYGMDGFGTKLTWTVPWTGKSPGLPVGELDPMFVEICRLVRLTADAETSSLRALRRGSEAQRVAGKDLRGCVGDLWTPLDRKYSAERPSAFQIGKSGVSYSTVAELLYPQTEARFIPCPAQKIQPSDGDAGVDVLFGGIARGQKGVSAGLQYRKVIVPARAVGMLRRGQLSPLSQASKERVNAIGKMKREVLWPALTHLFDTGKSREKNEKTPDSVKDRANTFCSMFELAEDARFFDDLNREIETDDPRAERLAWQISLAKRAEAVLRSAFAIGPQCGERRYRARSRALSYFHGALRGDKHFPALAHHLRTQPAAEEAAS